MNDFAHPIGITMGDMVPPEEIGEKARWLEQLGYSYLMIPEDYFYEPALVCCVLALAATDSVPIGTSIVSGLVRSPAVLAMEIAASAARFPAGFAPESDWGCRSGCDRWGSCRTSPWRLCGRAFRPSSA